jgi:hypothetical protein
LSRFVPLSIENHQAKRWRRPDDYRFAATQALAPIVGVELASATLAMPLALIEEAGRYTLVALLSPTPGRNLFVASSGHWLGSHIPAFLRAHPFRLLAHEGGDKATMLFDEDSGLLVEGNGEGAPFFDPEGRVSPELQAAVDYCNEVNRSRIATDHAIVALNDAGLIQPWSFKLKSAEHGEQTIVGLYRVDEKALKSLSDEAFLQLRRTGALPIAYAQMLSVGHLSIFERLAQIHRQLEASPKPQSIEGLFQASDDGLLHF